jgi:cytochrome c-type biogenesis protein CcmH
MIGFWIVAALLTAGVVIALVLPLMRKAAPSDTEGADLAVYRDQLAELERDKARGLLESTEAASLETEIARRMLNAAREAQPALATVTQSRALTLAIAVLFPIGGLVIYLAVGQPDLPGLPLAERGVAPEQDPAKLMASIDEIKGRLKQDKSDLDRWIMVGEAYEKLGHPREAVEAFRTARQIAPDDIGVGAALGEALINADGGAVGEEAKKLFAAVPENSETSPEAQYYLALAAAQAGDMKTALKQWQTLLANSPADASWIDPTRQRIADAAQALGLDPAKETPAPKPAATASSEGPLDGGPDTPEGQAIRRMAPEQQAEMIKTMVDRLAAKLQANPDDPDGWRRLSRAYEVMGDEDKAKDAEDKANQAEARLAGKAPAGPVATQPTAAPAESAGPPPEAPNSAEGQAIRQMAPDQQSQMIRGMVDRLAAKLEANPNDPDGWRRLANAYEVLGENDKAKAAMDRAAQAAAKAAKP